MLTKEERAAIAERLKNAGRLNEFTFYEALTGKQMAPSWDLRAGEVLNIIVNLCDTSNMVELPLDKDGKVIRVGDTVYEREGAEWRVTAINLFENGSNVFVRSDNVGTTYRSNVLTHKKPTKNAVLAAQIRAVVRSAISMPNFAVNKLSNIAEQLESLGDSDD